MKKITFLILFCFQSYFILSQKYSNEDGCTKTSIEVYIDNNDSLNVVITITNKIQTTIAIPFEEPPHITTTNESLYLNIGLDIANSANMPLPLTFIAENQSIKKNYKIKGTKSKLVVQINYILCNKNVAKKFIKKRNGNADIYLMDYISTMKWNELVLPIFL